MSWLNQKDYGRSAIVKKGAFKMPSLRNTLETCPYYCDSCTKTLENDDIKMTKHQLVRELSKQQRTENVILPECKTGELQKFQKSDMRK